jgi:hypothetical protein
LGYTVRTMGVVGVKCVFHASIIAEILAKYTTNC